MTSKTAARIRTTYLAGASLLLALLVGSTTAASDQADDTRVLEPELIVGTGAATGLDPAAAPQSLVESTTVIEHRVDLGRATGTGAVTGLDPAAAPQSLVESTTVIEHRVDLGRATGLDQVAQTE